MLCFGAMQPATARWTAPHRDGIVRPQPWMHALVRLVWLTIESQPRGEGHLEEQHQVFLGGAEMDQFQPANRMAIATRFGKNNKRADPKCQPEQWEQQQPQWFLMGLCLGCAVGGSLRGGRRM